MTSDSKPMAQKKTFKDGLQKFMEIDKELTVKTAENMQRHVTALMRLPVGLYSACNGLVTKLSVGPAL